MQDELDELKSKLDAHRPFSDEQMAKIDAVLVPRRVFFTNTFEDNSLTLEETKYYIETNRMVGGKLEREFHEIKGVVDAISYLRDQSRKNGDLSEEMIKELHAVLTKPIGQDERYGPGEYKSRDIPILGEDGSRINFAQHRRVPQEIASLLKWYGEKAGQQHPLEVAARFHYRLALIHPFMDGNGRVARLLDDFILEKWGYGPAIVEDRGAYFEALHQADSQLPAKDRIAASADVDLSAFMAVLGRVSLASMQLMLDVLEERFKPPQKDLTARLEIFDKTISGDTASETDRRLLEEKEATKLALGREIAETLKGKIQSKFVQFGLSGPAKFQQNNHQYSPLISEVTARHQFSFSPSESLYEYHLVPDLEGLEKEGMPMEPFMKLLSFAILSSGQEVGVFSGLLTFEFGRIYIKQENREEIVMKLDADSIRELLGSTSYEDWDLKGLNDFIYNSLDNYFHRIESDYLESKNNTT